MVDIHGTAERLVRMYKTRDPFELLDALRVVTRFTHRFDARGLKGFCTVVNRTRYVVINGKLEESEQRVVASHEAGHIVLHGKELRVGALRDLDIFRAVGKEEREANCFGANLLIPDEEVLDLMRSADANFLRGQALGVPRNSCPSSRSLVERGCAACRGRTTDSWRGEDSEMEQTLKVYVEVSAVFDEEGACCRWLTWEDGQRWDRPGGRGETGGRHALRRAGRPVYRVYRGQAELSLLRAQHQAHGELPGQVVCGAQGGGGREDERMNAARRRGRPGYKRCAFAGHRPQKLPFGFDEADPRCVAFKEAVKEAIEALIGEGYAHFLSGGALGMDLFAAEAVLELQQKYPWIILEMVSPFDAQAAKWARAYQLRRDRLFAAADIVTATGHAYTKGCMFRRNRYLVDNADLLLAAYTGQPGGTAMTVDYARKSGIQVPASCQMSVFFKSAGRRNGISSNRGYPSECPFWGAFCSSGSPGPCLRLPGCGQNTRCCFEG